MTISLLRQSAFAMALMEYSLRFQTAQGFSIGTQPYLPRFVFHAKLTSEELSPRPDLMPMDVVVFSEYKSEKKMLGAVQDDGKIAVLSAWTTEFAFDESVEFVVDEEDLPGHDVDENGGDIIIHSIVPENLLSYGSRQVGGGKGPGNPHGEESECIYYVDNSILEGIEVDINPALEILW